MQHAENMSDHVSGISELSEENKILFDQLNIVQKELEKYINQYSNETFKNINDISDDGNLMGSVTLPQQHMVKMSDSIKWHVLLEQLQIARKVETTNSMSARVGQVLLDGVSSFGSLLALPSRLYKMWKKLARKTPPDILGGESFQKVIKAYEGGGDAAVEKLLNTSDVSHVMSANAYTALARYLADIDKNKAAYFARQAWEIDPRPYRLKWMVFRLFDAGDIITSAAFLAILPKDIIMSNSERKKMIYLNQRINFFEKNRNSGINNVLINNESKKENSKLLIEKAKIYFDNCDYVKAKICYEHFQYINPQFAENVDINIKYCNKMINTFNNISLCGNTLEDKNLGWILSNILKINNVYLINMSKDKIKLYKSLREMNRNGIKIERIEGIDGKKDELAQIQYKNFQICKTLRPATTTRHISNEKRKCWNKTLTAGVFGYLLAQRKIFQDAIDKGYKRILIFDDDVYFHTNAKEILIKILSNLPDNFKLLALGVSEYGEKKSYNFINYRLPSSYCMYHPIPGLTCGSFATVYDKSIFSEIIKYIDEASGPFDNVTLGTIYLKYNNDCFVAEPSICIPDVSTSNIRKIRDQKKQSILMNWDMTRYKEYIRKFRISIILESITNAKDIILYKEKVEDLDIIIYTYDGNKIKEYENDCNLEISKYECNIKSSKELYLVAANNINSSDLVLLWPSGKKFHNDSIYYILTEALLKKNDTEECNGYIDGVYYCLDCGEYSKNSEKKG